MEFSFEINPTIFCPVIKNYYLLITQPFESRYK